MRVIDPCRRVPRPPLAFRCPAKISFSRDLALSFLIFRYVTSKKGAVENGGKSGKVQEGKKRSERANNEGRTISGRSD